MPEPSDPILLIHGQPGSARDWERVREELGDRARSVAFDRPGWDRRTPATDLSGNARAALAELDRERIERATIVGHSFGGAVAAWLAVEHPERVARIVLVAPSANRASLNRVDEVLGAPFVGPALAAAGLSGAGFALTVGALRRRIGALLAVDDPYLEREARVLLSPAAWRAFVIEQRALLGQLPALESRLGRISAPATVVVGTADQIVSPASARQLAAEIEGAELVEIEGARHMLPVQEPGRLADLILAGVVVVSA